MTFVFDRDTFTTVVYDEISRIIYPSFSISDYPDLSNTPETIFYCSQIPKISLYDYIRRMIKYYPSFPSIIPFAILYLRRIRSYCGLGFINDYTIHRLLIVSLFVATKFFDDQEPSLSYFASVGGISDAEMAELETEFLFLIQFSLYVNENVVQEEIEYYIKNTSVQLQH